MDKNRSVKWRDRIDPWYKSPRKFFASLGHVIDPLNSNRNNNFTLRLRMALFLLSNLKRENHVLPDESKLRWHVRIILRDESQIVGNSPLRSSSPTLNPSNPTQPYKRIKNTRYFSLSFEQSKQRDLKTLWILT